MRGLHEHGLKMPNAMPNRALMQHCASHTRIYIYIYIYIYFFFFFLLFFFFFWAPPPPPPRGGGACPFKISLGVTNQILKILKVFEDLKGASPLEALSGLNIKDFKDCKRGLPL